MSRSAMSAALGVAAFFVLGCDKGSASPQEASARAEAPDSIGEKPAAAAKTGPVSAPASNDALARAICASAAGKPCHVTDVKDGGSDGTTRLQVVEVAYVDDPKSSFKDANLDACQTWALWLARVEGGAVADVTKLVEFCNDGYGASGIGEDAWEVKGSELTVSKVGGSNWRWSNARTLDLRDRSLIEVRDDSFFSSGPEIEDSATWNHARFEGHRTWTSTVCGKETVVAHQASLIPKVRLPASYATRWKSVELGECGTYLDGQKGAAWERGYVVHGKLGAPDDTEMKLVVSSDDILYVEVLDDTLVKGARSWIHGDHLELWVSPETPRTMAFECVDPADRGKAWQWGIDALDGTVHPAHGKPTHKLVAEVSTSESKVRFKVALPPRTQAITVVYSDSDDGKSQERLLATSTFEFGRVQTMGFVQALAPEEVVCIEKGEFLGVERKPLSKLLTF